MGTAGRQEFTLRLAFRASMLLVIENNHVITSLSGTKNDIYEVIAREVAAVAPTSIVGQHDQCKQAGTA